MKLLFLFTAVITLFCTNSAISNQDAIAAMIKEADKEQAAIQARITEIDAKLDPILEKIALGKFYLQPAEFQFLRKQKESPEAAKDFFKKRDRVFEESLEDIADYLDQAYSQIRNGNLMFGKESTLVQKDAQLYNFMEKKIHEEIAVRDDGKELLDLIEERKTLKNKRTELGPVADYLTERREWWKNHPGYLKHIELAP